MVRAARPIPRQRSTTVSRIRAGDSASRHISFSGFLDTLFRAFMHGYSDRINHAFAFAAKYYVAVAPAGAGMDYLAHPANVAIILARYGCEQVTIVAGILHHVLEETSPEQWPLLEHKISEKFGPVVLAVAKDALEPKYNRRGGERPWQACKQEYLGQLATAEPRALDI